MKVIQIQVVMMVILMILMKKVTVISQIWRKPKKLLHLPNLLTHKKTYLWKLII